MCNKTFDNYVFGLEFLPDCYKSQKMCNKAVDTHTSAIQFVPQCCYTHKMSDKDVFLAFVSVPD